MGRGKRTGRSAPRGISSPRGTFNPGVVFDEGAVSIVLPELGGLIGTGADLEHAQADLLDEIRLYAEQYAASPALQGATNRRDHARLLQLIAEADAEGRLEDLLFAPPPGALAGSGA